jgi:hypothetical protein
VGLRDVTKSKAREALPTDLGRGDDQEPRSGPGEFTLCRRSSGSKRIVSSWRNERDGGVRDVGGAVPASTIFAGRVRFCQESLMLVRVLSDARDSFALARHVGDALNRRVKIQCTIFRIFLSVTHRVRQN